MEAQRYPLDFNGIAAGDAALDFTVQNSFYHAWNALSNTAADGRAILTADKLPILHAAALATCDAGDGLEDGVISDPLSCHFDPVVTECRSGQDPSTCLTAAQVDVARKIYAGARSPQGERLVVSGPLPGSELAWAGVYVPQSPDQPLFSRVIATDSVKYLYFQQPLPSRWSLRDLKFDGATLRSFKLRGLYDATDPNLAAFRDHGGKLIMYHGWADQHISPLYSIAYYRSVEQLFGAGPTRSFARLFMFPGMYHCMGGTGPSHFDVLTPLMTWVERQRAPEAIVATQLKSDPQGVAMPMRVRGPQRSVGPDSAADLLRTRPAYPYPAVAIYDGHGNPDEASSFEPSTPRNESAPAVWAGEGFFTSGYELWCAGRSKELQCTRHAPRS